MSHRPFPIIWRFQSSVSHLTTKQGSRDFKGKTRNPRFSIRCYSLPPVSDGLRVSRVRGSGSRGNEGIIRRQVKIFQAKGKGSETWRRESVRSYDRKFDSNLPPSLSLSFHRWIRLLSRSRPDKLSSSGRKQVFVFLRPRRENSINPNVAALIERDRIRPRVKDRADTDCAILIYSWGKKGLAFVQFPIRGTSLPMQRWNRERERSTRFLSLFLWISFRIYQPVAVSYTSLPRDRILRLKLFQKKNNGFSLPLRRKFEISLTRDNDEKKEKGRRNDATFLT